SGVEGQPPAYPERSRGVTSNNLNLPLPQNPIFVPLDPSMEKKEEFRQVIEKGNATKGGAITLGGAMLAGEAIEGAHVKVPLRTMNRHGLICGATGSGKTKTLQIIAEQLSMQG